MHTRFQRHLSAIALASMILTPFAVKAVTVTTDLQGELIKGSQKAVYFYGEDHKRYVFPNDKIFFTWYSDFSSVRTITDEELAAIPIGGNVTYRPGTKLVKVTTDPKVYAVAEAGRLRWITSEQIARALYGEDWAKQVQDVPDAFFGDYEVGTAIQRESDYQSDAYRNAYHKIEALIAAKKGETPTTDSESTSSHQIALSAKSNLEFSWTDTATSPLGYKVVWSTVEHPTYPTRESDSYIYLDSSGARSVSLAGKLASGKTYYVRVCEYLGGKCGAYSNQVKVTGTANIEEDESESDKPESSSGTITVKSTGSNSISWTDTGSSENGYKVVYSLNERPTYPTREGDTYLYFSDSSTRSAKLEGLESGKTYYVRVCEYLGGKCGVYSNQITVKAAGTTSEESSETSSHVIVVKSTGGKNISWTDTATSPNGYKVVYSENANPTYPTREDDTYQYFSSPSTKSATLDSVESGHTYYVRVCEYLGGKCGAYSNQIKVTISGTSETSSSATHTIVLKSNGQGSFSWTDTANSSMGYKVVYSENANPTYPTREGDTYQYYDNPSTRSTTISDLEDGHTYYVRVCEYLGGKCGAYSNQVTYQP